MTKILDTKLVAMEYGQIVAGKQQCKLIVQKLNGRIQSKDSYGNDPCPPKDKEH